ncbi:MAG TPA: hypothetical protein VFK69_06040, partial [Candidatus Eisenbacteria bacterium]|nr:hypothetical protein [Candidatus Eisenbacteria bacterium]
AALRAALRAAAGRRTAPAWVAFVLRCFHAPPPGSRSARLLNLVRWTCAGFALGMAGVWALGTLRLRARRGGA